MSTLKFQSCYAASQQSQNWENMLHIYQNDYTITNILSKLRIFLPDEINILNFCELLYKTNSIIAGSFTLQCYLNENYKNSDLDIFTLTPEIFQNIFISLKFVIFDQPNYNKFTVYESKNKSSKIQLIKPKETFRTVNELIEKTFDLNICMIKFNGYNIIITDEIKWHIKEKTMIIVNEDYLSTNRIDKYKNRGFKLLLNEHVIQLNNVQFMNCVIHHPTKKRFLISNEERPKLFTLLENHLKIQFNENSFGNGIMTIDNSTFAIFNSFDKFIITCHYNIIIGFSKKERQFGNSIVLQIIDYNII